MTEYLGYALPAGTRLAPHEIGGGYLYRENELLLDNRVRRDESGRSALTQVLDALRDSGFRRQVAQDILGARRLVAELPWPGDGQAAGHGSGYYRAPAGSGDGQAAGHATGPAAGWYDERDRVEQLAAALKLEPEVSALPNGILKLTLPPTDLTEDLVPIVVARLSALEFVHGRTPPQVTPNHVLWGAGHGRPYAVCPPYPARRLPPLLEADPPPARRVRVALLDGVVDPDHELFRRCDGSRVELFDESAREKPYFAGQTLPAYAGHGDFMAGVVALQAPEATVLALRVFRSDGTVDDDELAAAIDRLQADDADIVLMCLGGYAHDNRAMPATAAALESLRSRAPRILFVAGAGNDSVDTELFPAAFADVLGIGAVDRDGNPTCFTNFGPWVDACTDGSATVSAFVRVEEVIPADHTSNCLGVANPGEVDFDGYARWRGTSVAAARFAGKVAARMAAEQSAEDGCSPSAREVAARMVLLADGDFVPGLGPRV